MTDESHAPKTIDEQGNHCFGCGPLNPQGLGLVFKIDADALTATAFIELTRLHEGPPGYVHGGIIATMLDEAMSKLNRPLQAMAVTRHLDIDYLRPVPLHTKLEIRAHYLRRDGRKLFHAAEIVNPEGRVLARAKGLFVAIDSKSLNVHRQER